MESTFDRNIQNKIARRLFIRIPTFLKSFFLSYHGVHRSQRVGGARDTLLLEVLNLSAAAAEEGDAPIAKRIPVDVILFSYFSAGRVDDAALKHGDRRGDGPRQSHKEDRRPVRQRQNHDLVQCTDEYDAEPEDCGEEEARVGTDDSLVHLGGGGRSAAQGDAAEGRIFSTAIEEVTFPSLGWGSHDDLSRHVFLKPWNFCSVFRRTKKRFLWVSGFLDLKLVDCL